MAHTLTASEVAPWVDATGWAVSAGASTTVAAAADGFTIHLEAGDSYAEVTSSLAVDLSGSGSFLSFYVTHGAGFYRLSLGLSVAGAVFTKRWEGTVHYSSEGVSGVKRRVTVPLAKLSAAGGAVTADLADVRAIRLQVFNSGGASTDLTVTGPLAVHTTPLSGVCIVLDDARDSSYTVARDSVQSHGLTANLAVASALVGTSGHMSTDEISEMYEDGWGILNHSLNHNGMSGMTAAAAAAEVTGGLQLLEDNGWTRDSDHFVYPGGSWDQTVLDTITPMVRSARLASNQDYVTPGVANMHLLRPWYLTKTVALATVEGAVDKVQDRGGVMYLTFHDLVGSTSATEDWLASDFETLMAYLETNGVRTFHPHQLWPGVNAAANMKVGTP